MTSVIQVASKTPLHSFGKLSVNTNSFKSGEIEMLVNTIWYARSSIYQINVIWKPCIWNMLNMKKLAEQRQLILPFFCDSFFSSPPRALIISTALLMNLHKVKSQNSTYCEYHVYWYLSIVPSFMQLLLWICVVASFLMYQNLLINL